MMYSNTYWINYKNIWPQSHSLSGFYKLLFFSDNHNNIFNSPYQYHVTFTSWSTKILDSIATLQIFHMPAWGTMIIIFTAYTYSASEHLLRAVGILFNQ